MFEFKNLNNKKNDKEDNADDLLDFLELCEFVERNKIKIAICAFVLIFVILAAINFLNSFVLNFVLALLVTRLIMELVFAFTTDKQYEKAYKALKYPMVFNSAKISEEDELANIDNANPKIPGVEFLYDITDVSDDKFAVTFQVDEDNYKVLSVVDCPEKGKNFVRKIDSDTLMASFEGLKKQYVFDGECLIFNIVKLVKDADKLDIVNKDEIDDALIVTENLYYPYIK